MDTQRSDKSVIKTNNSMTTKNYSGSQSGSQSLTHGKAIRVWSLGYSSAKQKLKRIGRTGYHHTAKTQKTNKK